MEGRNISISLQINYVLEVIAVLMLQITSYTLYSAQTNDTKLSYVAFLNQLLNVVNEENLLVN